MGRYRRRYRKRYNPTYNWQNRVSRKNKIISVPGRFPLPQRLKTSFTYNNIQSFSSVAGALVRYVYRGNSCYDPDVTNTGLQPQLWDDLMGPIYSKYAVISSKINITVVSNTTPWKFTIVPVDFSSGQEINWEALVNFPKAKRMITSTLYGNNSISKLSNYATTMGIINVDPTTDDSQQTPYNQNAGTQWYWQIVGQPVDGSSTDTCYVSIELIYYCILSSIWPSARD